MGPLDLKAGIIGPAGEPAGPVELLIAGGGPAGLAAALYASRYRIATAVLEGYAPGGQLVLTDRIENYPGVPSATGRDLAEAMRRQALDAGASILPAQVTGASVRADGRLTVTSDAGEHVADTILIATGAAPAKLGVPGEERYYGRGVSYCATCDAPFFRNRKVLVVGGGDSAVKEALHLAGYASEVTLIHRRDALRAEPILAEKIKAHERVRILWRTRLREITGTDAGVEGVVLETPEGLETLPMDGVFMYVGRKPATGPFANLVDLAPDGSVATHDVVRTSRESVFAAGDVTDHPLRQVVTAVADGARAAAAAYDYLQMLPGRKG
jgi:thioredoxin reductase (NADPH)